MIKRIFLILLLGFAFVSAATIKSVDVKGYKDGDKLKSIINLSAGDKYNPSAIQRARRVMQHALRSSGYPKAIVRSRVVRKKGGYAVVFDVATGKKLTIEKVVFRGNKKVSSDDLKKDLVNQEAHAFSFLTGKGNGAANLEQLKYDQARVQDKYYQNGYLDARVSRPSLKINHSTNKATISYRILREGAQYKVSGVFIAMTKRIPGVDGSSLAPTLKLQKGDIFNSAKLREDIQSIAKKLGDKGYAFARVIPRFRKNSRAKTIRISYLLKPGSKVTIGNVRIHGNTKTKDHVVRRYIKLAPGDKFSTTALIKSQERLARSGFFDRAVVKPKRVSSRRMDLDVDVKDAKTGALTAAAGYNTATGFFVEGSVSDKNILGSGIEAGASVTYSKTTKSYNLYVSDPMVLDSEYSLSAGIYKNDNDYSKSATIFKDRAYTSKNDFGGYLSIGRQFTDEIYASVGYSYKNVAMAISPKANPALYPDYVKSSILASIVYDNTDDYYTPRHGIYAKGDLEYAGLGGAAAGKKVAKFTKIGAKLAYYYGLEDAIGYDLIFRLKARGNYITHGAGTYVPEPEKLFLGGSMDGVRGFEYGSIAPAKDSKGFSLGGYESYVVSAEASVPLSVEQKIRFTLFADYGQIGVNSLTVTQKSVGAQIEWRSPFGPLNFIYAKAISPDKAHGTPDSFEFSIKTKF